MRKILTDNEYEQRHHSQQQPQKSHSFWNGFVMFAMSHDHEWIGSVYKQMKCEQKKQKESSKHTLQSVV